uniref:Orofacial cleft 1 candidate 1 n=1 Tax=Otus sunia TaxID=257818 RepID=A0A8C8AH95_9STRI
ISLQKFQQKALKQTKQKKSKSAEFLMVKEERAATEGIENPAFNISSTDLSAYQPSEEKVIRHDKPDSTLAAHQQKFGLQAHAEPRGETSNLISLKFRDSSCGPHPIQPVYFMATADLGSVSVLRGLRVMGHRLCEALCQLRGEHREQTFVAALPCILRWVGFWRHHSRSKHTNAAPLLAPEH